jgi:hypothetical protein
MKALVLAVLVAGATGVTLAEDLGAASGSFLLSKCNQATKIMNGDQDADITDAAYCFGYVNAAFGSLQFIKKASKAAPYCLPEGVTGDQLIRIVQKYLADHPENLHYVAYGEVYLAITKAFPCSATPTPKQ